MTLLCIIIIITLLIYSFGDGVQYPVLGAHLPENNHVIGGGGVGGNIGGTTAYYESMGHSVALNIEKSLNAIGDDDDDDNGIENIQLDNGLRKSDSISNVSTKASTGALLANEGDDNLSVSSSTARQTQTVINITTSNSNKNNINDNNINRANGTIATDIQNV